jgi:hypothetical protein
MIFEVESSASASMANNAMKVFSRDVDDFVKPLFFFHVLLQGGPDNERIAGLRRTWGTYNYRVYRLNDPSEKQRLVSDILGQHRRVSAELGLASLDIALCDALPSVSSIEVFQSAERLDFSANYLGDLTRRAIDNVELRPLLLARLRASHVGGQAYRGYYGTYIGKWFSGLLEIALLVGTGPFSIMTE